MGYTKITQFGDTIEIYEYEKNISHHRKSHISPLSQKRNKAIREDKKKKGQYERSKSSIKRSRNNFFRLCHHNNHKAKTINFLSLTFAHDLPFQTASRYVRRFLEKLAKTQTEIPISYISVPELTKKGRFHFHLLIYNLPPEISKRERKTRNLQRLFERGYVDIVPATYTSRGIAAYMSKYMGKALTDFKNETTRGYTCSRNIEKIYSAGGNTLSQYAYMIIPNLPPVQKNQYEVPFLGKCHYKKIISKL